MGESVGPTPSANEGRPNQDAAHAQTLTETKQNRLGSDKVARQSASSNSDNVRSRRLSQNRSKPLRTYAALDLGTNNCRLLIAEARGRSYKVIDGFSRIVRLGEGLEQTGDLSAHAMDKAIQALKICKSKLDKHQPHRAALIATQACRQAGNSSHFLERVHQETGIELDVIDRETEARLAVTGCAELIDAHSDGVILFDIGGGSSELAWLDFSGGMPRNAVRMAGAMRSWRSLPFGVVTIAEKFAQREITRTLFDEMVNFATKELVRFKGRAKLQAEVDKKNYHFLGTSGTVTTLGGIHKGLKTYQRNKIDGLWLSDKDIEAAMTSLLDMNYEQRVAHPCVGRDRADLVIPGCAIFEAIRRVWPCNALRVADRGLREGLLVRMMSEDGYQSRQTHIPTSKQRPRRGRGGRNGRAKT